MAHIKAFKAIRPKKEFAEQVAALPYDVVSRQEARLIIKKNPLSFLSVDRPEAMLPDEVNFDSDEAYAKASSNYCDLLSQGILGQDQQACLYLYQLTREGRRQVGLVCCCSVFDYEKEIIKKHEQTRADKEADRIRHIESLNANTGPIFLAYKSRPEIKSLIREAQTGQAWTSFISDDGVEHTIWEITEPDLINRLIQAFGQVDSLYIADGHHRCAAAVKIAQKRRTANPHLSSSAECNYFLSVIFADDQLEIMDYNRLVKDLAGLSQTEFLAALSPSFTVEKAGSTPYRPSVKGEFSMYLDHCWYRVKVRSGPDDQADPVARLDVAILQEKLLGPILDIKDPRTDQRISFVGGIRGLEELARQVDSGAWSLAFALYPTSINELFDVADAGLLMPPKSTWFEPKLRSGLFIHNLD